MKKQLIIALMALLPVACSSSEPAAPALDAAAVAAGKKVYVDNGCVACHGETGMGDTVVGKALTPPPRDYTNAKWQSDTSDEQIKKTLAEGREGTAMVAYKNITGTDLENLVTFIRSLKK
jgi:mono/diheme cytochrome c family protein